MELILDTNFVIATERESRRKSPDRAARFADTHSGDIFFITFTVAAELAAGQSATPIANWQRLCRPYAILPWSLDISWQYGEIYRHLARTGSIIGTNDLWIAATAIVHQAALVTNNLAEFKRVPGLQVLEY